MAETAPEMRNKKRRRETHVYTTHTGHSGVCAQGSTSHFNHAKQHRLACCLLRCTRTEPDPVPRRESC